MKFKLVESIINEVYPNKGESKKDFIARFMSVTKDEYPDVKQRFAVANSYWDRRDKKGVNESKEQGIDLDKLCKDLNKKHYAFGGNCGFFALAIARELSKRGIDSSIIIASDMDEEDVESVRSYGDNEPDIYHVAIKVGDKIYDGNGETSIQSLKDIAEEEYGDLQPTILEHSYSKDNDDDFRFAFEWSTNYDVDAEYYQELIEKELGK